MFTVDSVSALIGLSEEHVVTYRHFADIVDVWMKDGVPIASLFADLVSFAPETQILATVNGKRVSFFSINGNRIEKEASGTVTGKVVELKSQRYAGFMYLPSSGDSPIVIAYDNDTITAHLEGIECYDPYGAAMIGLNLFVVCDGKLYVKPSPLDDTEIHKVEGVNDIDNMVADDRTVYIIDGAKLYKVVQEDGKYVAKPIITLPDTPNGATDFALESAASGKIAVRAMNSKYDDFIMIIDAETGAIRHVITGRKGVEPSGAALSPDGRSIAVMWDRWPSYVSLVQILELS